MSAHLSYNALDLMLYHLTEVPEFPVSIRYTIGAYILERDGPF